MLNSLFTRLQYKARILIPKNFFYLYKPPLDLSLIKNSLQETQTIHRFHDLFAKYPDFQTLRYGWTKLWTWLTNPQEHTSSWRTNQKFFPRNPLPIFNSARSSIVTTERYLVDPLTQWTKMIVCRCSWMKEIWEDDEDEVSFRFLSAQQIDAHNSLCYDHSISAKQLLLWNYQK